MMRRGHLMIMIRVYGLINCDTCRSVIKDLEKANINYKFYDFRRDGVKGIKIRKWHKKFGYDLLLNRRSATWRALSNVDKANLNDDKALNLMVNNPVLIKRPIIEMGKKITIGYKNEFKETLHL